MPTSRGIRRGLRERVGCQLLALNLQGEDTGQQTTGKLLPCLSNLEWRTSCVIGINANVKEGNTVILRRVRSPLEIERRPLASVRHSSLIVLLTEMPM
jgi:hypothetical protein